MKNEFSGKTTIISGAAGGIGFALAKQFGALGMNVVLADIDSEQLEIARQELEQAGVSPLCCELDVTDFSQWESVVAQAKLQFGKVHMVVNNAGVGGIPGSIEQTNHKTWDWVIDVNLKGVLFGAQAAVPAIKEHGEGGWIINVASMAGMHGVPYSTAYAATKAAVVSMSESWSVELKRDNIHVAALCPAFVKTRIHESGRNRQAKYRSDTPLGDPAQLKAGFTKVAALVESGIPADLLAQRVVEALQSKQNYIFTHPNYRQVVTERFAALNAAFDDAQDSPLVGHLKDEDMAPI